MKQITAYQCKCGKAYVDRNVAEKCCAPKYCEDCGAKMSPRRAYTVCESCRMKRMFNRAEKLETWDGWICCEEIGHNDGYFESVADLLDYCEAMGVDVPEWAFICKEIRHEIDVERVIENMLDDAYEDAREHLVDEEELREFIKEWNAKQDIVTYYPDYGKVVLIRE